MNVPIAETTRAPSTTGNTSVLGNISPHHDETGSESPPSYNQLNYNDNLTRFFNRYKKLNYRFLTTETNLKALYIFHCLFLTSSVKLFVVNVQILFTIFQKKEKQHSQNFFTFWKWKQISKKNHILKVKAHSRTNLINSWRCIGYFSECGAATKKLLHTPLQRLETRHETCVWECFSK